MNPRAALMEVLRTEGVDRIFGNPGTSELPLMDELVDVKDIHYVLALQEASAVAMADGYARGTGRPAFVNLHIAAGLANGLANVLNARRSHTPLVVTAGQQDRRHLVQDPMLSGDLVAMAGSICKMSVEVDRADDLATVVRRAFLAAQAPPTGPVFVSIPMDLLEEAVDVDVPERSLVRRDAVAGGVEEAAASLATAERPAIVAGDGIAREGALAEVVRVAETVGATVYAEPLNDAVVFPASHALFGGMMAPANAAIRGFLGNHDVVLVVGAVAFMPYPYTPVGAVPADVELLQIDPDPYEIGRTYPVTIGMVGSVKATLGALADQLDGRVVSAAERLRSAQLRKEAANKNFDDVARARYSPAPIDPMAAAHGLIDGLPDGGIVVDEAVTTGVYVRNFLAPSEPGRYHFTIGGGLGWALGAAIGVKMARPEAPVLAVIGDGSTMYALQGLWTAAHDDVPVVFAVVNNAEYRILKQGLDGLSGLSAKKSTYVGMDLFPPHIDFVGLARALGVAAERVDDAADVAGAVRAAFESGAPALVEVPIKRSDA